MIDFSRKVRMAMKGRKSSSSPLLAIAIILLLLMGASFGAGYYMGSHKSVDTVKIARELSVPEWVSMQLIPEGNPSRNQKTLDSVDGVVIHYVANPGSTAQNNRDYFAQEDSSVCSHFVIGLSGEIIQCLPLYEQSIASNERNHDTISIEVCHPDESGKFTDETYESLLKLTRWLKGSFNLSDDQIIRHYDVTGKICPKYFVDNPEAWEEFKDKL